MIRCPLLVSGSAFASQCGPVHEIYPRDGATNAIPRVTYVSSNPGNIAFFKHVGDERVEVSFDRRVDFDGWVTSLVPRERFEPNTTYTLMPSVGIQTGNTFTTGTREDFDAPVTPTFDTSRLETPETPNGYRKWRLQLLGVSDESSTNDQLLVLVHDAKNPGKIIGATDAIAPTLDIEVCGSNFDAPTGASFDVGLQVMDLAGNVSEVFTASALEGRGCSSAPGSLLMLALALFWRRR